MRLQGPFESNTNFAAYSQQMIHYRAAHPLGRKCLAWILLVAVVLMGQTITRQQALGSLHSHVDQGSHISTGLTNALSSLARDWLDRWQAQKAFGHRQLLPTNFHGAELQARAHVDPHSHDHSTLQRHHHAAGDDTVIALDGASASADTVDTSAMGVSMLLPIVWAPDAGLMLHPISEPTGPWPAGRLFAFSSRTVLPLLRPPSL